MSTEDFEDWIEEHEPPTDEASVAPPDAVAEASPTPVAPSDAVVSAPEVLAGVEEETRPAEPVVKAPLPAQAQPAQPVIKDPLPAETLTTWSEVLASYEASLVNAGKKRGGLGQLRSGAKASAQWLAENGFTPASVTPAQVEPLHAHIDATLKPPMTYVFKKAVVGLIEEAVAMKSRPATTVVPAPPTPPAKLTAVPTEKREEMAQQPTQPEEQYEEEQEQDQQEEQVEEAPRRRAAPRPQQVVFVAPPRAPRAPRPPATGTSPGVARVLGKNNGTVRVHRRGPRGQRVYIGDYSISDINGPMAPFLRDYVEPDQMPDPSGYAQYEVAEVGADGNEKGSAVPVTIPSNTGTQDPNDPLDQARKAMDFISQLREEETQKTHGSEALKAGQKKAAENGDMSSLVMMMMLEKMMSSSGQGARPEDVALKVMEQMKRNNGPSSFDMPHYPPPPPPQVMMPPPPPPSELAPIVGKLLEATIAAKADPKPEKTFMEQMKEMIAFKELLMPSAPAVSPEILMLRSEIAALRAQSQPKPESGMSAMVKTFSEMKEVVSTLAPQMNAGGLTGALQSVLTPKLAAAVGDMLAGGIAGARAAAQQPPPAQEQAQLPAQQQPRQLPAALVPLVAALKAADTEAKQVQATMEVLQGYYTDPAFTQQLEPALQALLGGNRAPGVRTVMQILEAHRPDMATAAFANKVIDGLIASYTGQTAVAEEPKPLVTPTPTTPLEVAPPAPPAEAPPVGAAPVPASEAVVDAAPAGAAPADTAPTEPVPEKVVFPTGKVVDPKDAPVTMPELVAAESVGASA